MTFELVYKKKLLKFQFALEAAINQLLTIKNEKRSDQIAHSSSCMRSSSRKCCPKWLWSWPHLCSSWAELWWPPWAPETCRWSVVDGFVGATGWGWWALEPPWTVVVVIGWAAWPAVDAAWWEEPLVVVGWATEADAVDGAGTWWPWPVFPSRSNLSLSDGAVGSKTTLRRPLARSNRSDVAAGAKGKASTATRQRRTSRINWFMFVSSSCFRI